MTFHPKLANMKIYLAYNNDDDKNANGDGAAETRRIIQITISYIRRVCHVNLAP